MNASIAGSTELGSKGGGVVVGGAGGPEGGAGTAGAELTCPVSDPASSSSVVGGVP